MSTVAVSTHLRRPDEPTFTIANGTLHAVSTGAFAVDLDLESEPVTIELDPGQPPSIRVGRVNMVFGEQRGHGRARKILRKRTGDGLAAGDDSHHQVTEKASKSAHASLELSGADHDPRTGVVVLLFYSVDFSKVEQRLRDFRDAWVKWQENFLDTNPSITPMLVFPRQDSRQELESVALQSLGLSDCPSSIDFDFGMCMHSMDDGNLAIFCRQSSQNRSQPVILSFQKFPGVPDNIHDAEIDSAVPRDERCPAHFRDYDYIVGTNWYASFMLRSPILQCFDWWFKIDEDVKFIKPMPRLLEAIAGHKVRPYFLHTKLQDDATWCAFGSGRFIRNFAMDLNRSPVSDSVYGPEVQAPYSNFVGGDVHFWTQPEMLRLASFYWTFGTSLEKGEYMWRYRWSDQQFWMKALGFFSKLNRMLDLSYLRYSYFTHTEWKG